MKNIFTICLGVCLGLGIAPEMKAQDTLASGFGLYVFPSNDQTKEQQDADEMACYRWAKEQSGVDPMNPPEVQAAQVDRSADGSAVVGAAGGAAAGAAKKYGDAKQQQANNAAAAAASEELMNNFKKAFSACMEGKGYTVK